MAAGGGRGPVLQVEGARQLRKSMAAAGIQLQDLKEAHRALAEYVVGVQRPPVVTGRLAATVRPGATRNSAIVRAGGARVPYAAVIHWGWEARHIVANKWLTRAVDERQETIEEKYMNVLEAIIGTIEGAPA